VDAFDLCGALRRIRRAADLSQRELAARIGVSKSAVAAAESGRAGLDVRAVARAAAEGGLQLGLVDEHGSKVTGMADGAVRDRGGRRFPAHLDTRYGDEGWWHGPHRYDRQQPWYTFDRDRWVRDRYRRHGVPDDHQLPKPGDAPAERAARRREEALRRWREERERRLAAGEIRPTPLWTCDCPAACDELDDRSGRPVHAAECVCLCDVG
jgi:HTH-type transcriptional regulator/antitoxin HipB